MVNTKRYNPSNKRFQKHTQSFVEGKTMKGHLGEGDKKGDKKKETGELIRVNRQKINENGWEVKVDKKKYHCTYGDNIIYLPPCKKTDKYYIPKKKCEVEVSIDEKTKLHTITKIKDKNKKPISMDNNGVKLNGSGKASVTVKEDKTEITGSHLAVQNDVKVDTTEQDGLPDEISLTDMYKKIQVIEEKLSDTDDS